jgi:hypothetical protein
MSDAAIPWRRNQAKPFLYVAKYEFDDQSQFRKLTSIGRRLDTGCVKCRSRSKSVSMSMMPNLSAMPKPKFGRLSPIPITALRLASDINSDNHREAYFR